MNERIRELAEQNFYYGTWEGDGIFTGQVDLEKFAQLIVRECIAHGKLTQSQTVVNGSEEYNSGREMGIEVFMNQIKQHFGVKE